LYQPANDITEMVEIWKFFNKWQHSNPTNLGVSNQTELEISVKPNPSTGLFEVTTTEKGQLSVLSLNGTVVFKSTVQVGANSIDLTNLPKGVYVLKFGLKTTKLVIH
jgi:hypothetical protein